MIIIIVIRGIYVAYVLVGKPQNNHKDAYGQHNHNHCSYDYDYAFIKMKLFKSPKDTTYNVVA